MRGDEGSWVQFHEFFLHQERPWTWYDAIVSTRRMRWQEGKVWHMGGMTWNVVFSKQHAREREREREREWASDELIKEIVEVKVRKLNLVNLVWFLWVFLGCNLMWVLVGWCRKRLSAPQTWNFFGKIHVYDIWILLGRWVHVQFGDQYSLIWPDMLGYVLCIS